MEMEQQVSEHIWCIYQEKAKIRAPFEKLALSRLRGFGMLRPATKKGSIES